jgi:uncharacterized protein (TIGR02271 family)
MDTGTTQTTARLYGYDVIDSAGNKAGSVDGVWVDDATNKPEFVSAKTGWLFGKSHIIPIEQATIDDGSQTIQVPYASDQIKDGPSFSTDAELSPDDENQIYDYYGLQRSTAQSPTGYAAGGGPSTTVQTMSPGATATGQDQIDVPLSEEELQVGKREVEAGRVRLRKVVRTEQEQVPVELRREDVEIERVPASGQDVPSTAFEEQEIDVPVTREEPVISKEARVTGKVQVGKDVETEQRTVGGEVRKEDVEIDRDTETEPADTSYRP